MADKRATFFVDLKGNASSVAKETSSSVDALTDSIARSESEIKDMSASLRKLRGSSAEVKAEKDKLKAAIGAEQQAITREEIALRKLGTTSAAVARQQKQLAEEKKKAQGQDKQQQEQSKKQLAALRTGLTSINGPASTAASKLFGLNDALEGMGGEEAAIVAAGASVGIIAAAAAAVVAVGGAAIYGAASLTKFIIESQAASRQMNIMRAAAIGSESNAANLGTQVDALAKSVPIAKSEINALGVELGRAGIRGDTLVHTMNAMAQAQGVGDTGLASQIEEIMKSGRMTGRTGLSPMDLFGKNLDFDDVAAALASGMNTSLDDARRALLAHQAPMEQAAAAIQKAVEKKFGGANKALLLDPSKQVEKFEENLKSLTSGVNIEPLLHDMHEFFDLFDPEKSVTGAAIKQIVTSLGGDLVQALHDSAPIAEDFVDGLVLGAIRTENEWLSTKISIKKGIKEIRDDVEALLNKFPELKSATEKVSGALQKHGGVGGVAGQTMAALVNPFHVSGMMTDVASAGGKALARAVDTGFRDEAEIHSPSKKMQRNVNMMVRPVVEGLTDAGPHVFDAMNVMLGPALRPPSGNGFAGVSAGSGDASSSGVRDVNLNVTIQVPSERAARHLESPTFQTQLKKTLRESLRQAGF